MPMSNGRPCVGCVTLRSSINRDAMDIAAPNACRGSRSMRICGPSSDVMIRRWRSSVVTGGERPERGSVSIRTPGLWMLRNRPQFVEECVEVGFLSAPEEGVNVAFRSRVRRCRRRVVARRPSTLCAPDKVSRTSPEGWSSSRSEGSSGSWSRVP